MENSNRLTTAPGGLFSELAAGAWKLYLALAILLGGTAGVLAVRLGRPIYLLAGLIGLFTFVGSVVSVEFGLLSLVFLAYTRFSDIAVHNYGSVSILQIFIALLVGAILVRWAVFHDRPRGWVLPVVLLSIYGVAASASILYAADTSLVIKGLTAFVKDAIIAVVVVILLQRVSSFRRVLWSLILAGVFLGTLSSFQFLTRTFSNDYGGFATAHIMQIVGAQEDYRIGGPIGDPNYFAQILIVILPIALERFLHERRTLLRALALWCALVCGAAAIFTYSRGGFFTLAFVMVVFLVIYPPRAFQIPVFIVSLLLFSVILPPNYWDRLLTLNQYFQTPGSIRTNDPALRGRATENLTALQMIKAHPLLGIGWRNYSTVYPIYAKSVGVSIANANVAAHDLYLEVAAETGFAGLTTFLLLIVIAVRSVVRARKQFFEMEFTEAAHMTTGFGLALMGYLISALFIHGAYPRYFYLMIGIALSLRQMVINTRENPNHGERAAMPA